MLKRGLIALALCSATGGVNAQTPALTAVEKSAIERRATEAFVWGLPAVNYDLMLQEMLGKTTAKVNQVLYWGGLMDARNQTLTPNPDTLYAMVFFDTKSGPVVLDLPRGDASGSFNGNIVTVWQMPLEDAGLRQPPSSRTREKCSSIRRFATTRASSNTSTASFRASRGCSATEP